jgi:hypothetical protein
MPINTPRLFHSLNHHSFQKVHCNENPIYVFLEMKLGGLVPNSYIHVSVSDLYIPRCGLSIWLQKNSWPILVIYKSLTDKECRNWETEHFNSVLEITRPAQCHFWEYINVNQTFIMDSHQLFICSVDIQKTTILGQNLRFSWGFFLAPHV